MTKQNKSENRNLLLFFLIAFGFTWLFWVPEALAMRGLLGVFYSGQLFNQFPQSSRMGTFCERFFYPLGGMKEGKE